MWKEKSKEKWLEDGDQNTKLFHLAMIIRRRANRIASVQRADRSVATEHDDIGRAFTDYFLHFFSSTDLECPRQLDSLFPPSLSSQDCLGLAEIPTSEEIKQVIFSMSNGKSSGPDGLSPLFFKFYWDLIHKKVIKAVQFFFDMGTLCPHLNHTYIYLIPKKDKPTLVE